MPVESDKDRMSYLMDFGVTAKVQGVDVLGILDQEFKDIGGVETFYPIFECRRSDAPNVSHGDSVVFEGESFYVASIENDRSGMQQLILSVGKSSKYIPSGEPNAYT